MVDDGTTTPRHEGPFREDVLLRQRHPDDFGTPLDIPSSSSGVRAAVSAIPRVLSLAIRRVARRSPLHHYRQVEAADCAAACLATVLDFYNRPATLRELRDALDTGTGGSTAGAIVRAARERGLIARGVRTEPSSVGLLPRGSVLHWNLGHFVVLDEVRRDGVVVVDPAVGHRFVTNAGLDRSFTGVAVVFEGERVRTRTRATRTNRWAHVLPVLRSTGLWRSIIVAAALGQVLVLSFPFLLRYVLDHVIAIDRRNLLPTLALLVVPMFLMHLVVLAVRSVSLSWLRGRVDYQLSLATLNKILSLRYTFLALRSTGDLLLRVRSTAALRQVFTTTVLSGIVDGATALTLIVVVNVLDPMLGIVTCTAIALQVGALAVSWRHQQDLAASGLEAQALSQGRLVELLSGIKTVKLAGAEAASADAWAQLLTEETNWEVERSIAGGVTDGVFQSLRLVTPVVLLFVGASDVLRGGVTTGSMVAAVTLATAALVPVTAMLSSAFQLAMVRGHLDRLNDVFDEDSEPLTGAVPADGGAVRLENVSFTYPGGEDVLRDVDVSVPAGTSLALVGPSGAGKSTLAMVVAGVYAPTTGRVLLGGVDVATIAPAVLRQRVAVVPQQPQFFRGTIRDNVTVFRDYPTEVVERAARVACIHDEVMSRPMAYETIVAERGESLSGGQLQRIGLARALLGQPHVLVLDEATSALDEATEARVVDNLLGLGITIVFITHRSSIAARADRVLTVRDGRAVGIDVADPGP